MTPVTSNCPSWCLVTDHSGDGADIIHVAFRQSIPADEGEVLVEVSSAEADFSDLSVDILGEACFRDLDDLGELLVVLAEAQAALAELRAD